MYNISNPRVLACKVNKILSILKNVDNSEEENPCVKDYPVLIGSTAAKWHIPSFREPKDWDLVTTPTQATSFINKIMPNATFKDIKLVRYPGAGLKIIGECIELHSSEDPVKFDIELASNKVDLRRMKLDEAADKEYNNKDNVNATTSLDQKQNQTLINTQSGLLQEQIARQSTDQKKPENDDDDSDDDDIKLIEFEKFDNNQPKMSAQMILDLCHDIEDKTLFPFSDVPCIVAPLKILEALKASHIYWPIDFHKNIDDLHSLRILLGYNQVPTNQPLCNLQRDEPIDFMLKTRIKETEARQGVSGAHINLDQTNEEFLDREDDLLVRRRIPHDELHERVKYGDRPIYETLKEDKV